jgi:hypothetical protein
VSGTVRIAIKADSIEDAKEQARKMQEDEESPNFTELDEVDEIRIDWVRKESPMYRVIRDGETMQVSHLDAGDIPREPDERGF